MSWPGYNNGDLFAIAVGGTAGAGLRWALTRTEQVSGGWFTYAPNDSVTTSFDFGLPASTLVVNLLGCLLLGALTALLARSLPVPRRLLIAAAVGFCGSLTTFSKFAVEIAERLRGVPAPFKSSPPFGPELGAALTYLILSLVGGALAFWLGRNLANRTVVSPGGVTSGEDQ